MSANDNISDVGETTLHSQNRSFVQTWPITQSRTIQASIYSPKDDGHDVASALAIRASRRWVLTKAPKKPSFGSGS